MARRRLAKFEPKRHVALGGRWCVTIGTQPPRRACYRCAPRTLPKEYGMSATRPPRRCALVLSLSGLATVALAAAPQIPSPVQQAANEYITRAALEAPIRLLA